MPTDSGVFRDDTDTPVGGRIIRAYRRDTGALIGSAVSSDGTATPGDAHLSNRLLLIRGSGASISDESSSPCAVAAVGNVAISNSHPKDGADSIGFDGSGDYLQLDGSSKLAFGAGDFTVEMWVYLASLSSAGMLYDFRPRYTNGPYLSLVVKPTEIEVFNASGTVASGGHGFVAGNWYHVAYCRASSVGRLFAHGTKVGGDHTDTTSYQVGANSPLIGANGYNPSVDNLNGAVVDIRVSNRAEYTGNFTPPTRFYANEPAAATPVGSYSITHSHTGERQLVFLDDAGGTTYNDKILRVV